MTSRVGARKRKQTRFQQGRSRIAVIELLALAIEFHFRCLGFSAQIRARDVSSARSETLPSEICEWIGFGNRPVFALLLDKLCDQASPTGLMGCLRPPPASP
jgi:hypothetical protein